MSYMTREFSGISSLFKIDLKLFSIVMIIVFLGMITLFSVSNGDSSLMLKQVSKDLDWTSCYDFIGTDPS